MKALSHVFVLLGIILSVFLFKKEATGQNYRGKEFISAYKNKPRYDSIVNFSDAKFFSIANFTASELDSMVFFNNATFNKAAIYNFTIFCSATNFRFSTFHRDAYFFSAMFRSNADFVAAKFDSIAGFTNSIFFTNANFLSARFSGETFFNGVVLPDTLGFRHVVEINKEIDFTNAKLDSVKLAKDQNYKCKITLTGSNIEKIKINYELFELWFPTSVTYEQKISTYEKLLQKFKNDGFLESYKKLDIEYRNFKNIQNGDVVLNWFIKHWWNYGYNREWVIYWALSILGSFIFLNTFLFEKLQKEVYTINFNFFTPEDYSRLARNPNFWREREKYFTLPYLLAIWQFPILSFAFVTLNAINSLMYTAILFFGVKISLENFKKFSGWTMYIWLMYVTGLFCLAYILNIIIVK